MRIAIIGYGLEGQAAYRYWREGNEITICDADANCQLPDGVSSQLGSGYLADLARFDLIVRSPGVHPQTLVAASSPAILTKVTSNINEFFQVSPTQNIIAVTGTKGKGTTSTLIAQMLEADGRRVHLGGNIGVAPLALLEQSLQPEDWVVLELSNFQLIDLKRSPYIAMCLMVVAEHLDWHTDVDEYIIAKTQLFRHQTSADIAIYSALDTYSERIASTSPAWRVPYMAPPGAYLDGEYIMVDNQPVCQTSEIRLPGEHNWQNVCAAITAMWKINRNVPAIRHVLTSFTGLEHRLELVRELDGVRYYDDSFGTTPETAIVALRAFHAPKVIILGGSDKGADYTALAQTVADHQVRAVLLIGEQAERIKQALMATGFTQFAPGGHTMPEIIENARSLAQPGDIVLLSPASASFDMFDNYKQRGELFKQAVKALA